LDCRTDVFAIGALLYFMCHGKAPGTDPEFDDSENTRELDRIIRGCMARNKEERYRNAKDVEQVLYEWKKFHLSDQAIESLNIVFVGAKPGVGTTHAALAMASFLARSGYQTLYQEECDTGAMRNLLHSLHVNPDQTGLYRLGCLSIRPYYGRAVKMSYRYFSVTIKDAGTKWKMQDELPDADFYILVCGGKNWEIQYTTHAIKYFKSRGKFILLWNHLSESKFRERSKEFDEVLGFCMPHVTDPFHPSAEIEACFREVLAKGGSETWEKRKHHHRRSGRKSLVSVVLEKVSAVRTFLSCW